MPPVRADADAAATREAPATKPDANRVVVSVPRAAVVAVVAWACLVTAGLVWLLALKAHHERKHARPPCGPISRRFKLAARFARSD